MKRILCWLSLLILFSITPAAADTLYLDGKRIQIVNGTLSDTDAMRVINFCKDKYKKGQYEKSIQTLQSFIRKYRGIRLADAKFLLAKNCFMVGDTKDSRYHFQDPGIAGFSHPTALENFREVWTSYKDSHIVQKGTLVSTLKTAVLRYCKRIENEFIDIEFQYVEWPLSMRRVVACAMYHGLYNEITGKSIKEFNRCFGRSYKRTYVNICTPELHRAVIGKTNKNYFMGGRRQRNMSSKGNISTANWQSMLFLTGVGRNIQQEATMLGFKAVHLWGNLPSNGSYHKDAVARAFPMVRGQQMTFNGKPIKATYEVRVKNTAQSVLEIRYGEYKMVSRIVGESYFNNVRDFYMKIETLFMPLDTIYSLSRYGKAAAKSKSIDNL